MAPLENTRDSIPQFNSPASTNPVSHRVALRAERRREGAPKFFDDFGIRPLRGGSGRVSTRSSCYELDVPFFPGVRSELGGPSVAVRGGVELGVLPASSMSRFLQRRKSSSEAPPWRCGAGLNSEVFLRARSDFCKTHLASRLARMLDSRLPCL